jgi:hypothetical protein
VIQVICPNRPTSPLRKGYIVAIVPVANMSLGQFKQVAEASGVPTFLNSENQSVRFAWTLDEMGYLELIRKARAIADLLETIFGLQSIVYPKSNTRFLRYKLMLSN